MEEGVNPYKAGDVVWGVWDNNAEGVGSAVVAKATPKQIRLTERSRGFGFSYVISPAQAYPSKAAALTELIRRLVLEAENRLRRYNQIVNELEKFKDMLEQETA